MIVFLNVGRATLLAVGNKTVRSGIAKTPVDTAYLRQEGLDGDEQADLKVHGGPDKAVCLYPYEHYAAWEERLGSTLPAAAFGENLTVRDLLEDRVCIGDIYRVGEALVQITQPRQPCAKLASHLNQPLMPKWVLESGFTGFYARCLHPGRIERGSILECLEKHPLGVSVHEAHRIRHASTIDRASTEKLLAVEALSTSWRAALESRLDRL